jgi:hypothetical protein
MLSKPFVILAAILVLGICTYLFLSGNKVFEGKFADEPLAWYFFAKGIFCSVSLVLTQELLEAVRDLRK